MSKPLVIERTIKEIRNYDEELADDVELYKFLLNDTLKMLNKALDKACTELDLSNKQLMALDSRFIRMTKEQWKEYLLTEREQ